MTSEPQVLANRRNASKSTGPRTTQGKARASKNALRHGAFAGFDALTCELLYEDPDQVRLIGEAIISDFAPESTAEEMVTVALAERLLGLQRLDRLVVPVLDGVTARESPSHAVEQHQAAARYYNTLEIAVDEIEREAPPTVDYAMLARRFRDEIAPNQPLKIASQDGHPRDPADPREWGVMLIHLLRQRFGSMRKARIEIDQRAFFHGEEAERLALAAISRGASATIAEMAEIALVQERVGREISRLLRQLGDLRAMRH